MLSQSAARSCEGGPREYVGLGFITQSHDEVVTAMSASRPSRTVRLLRDRAPAGITGPERLATS